MTLPRLIQGGMGAGVSGWQLARAVSMLGQLGVVSGTALDSILVRRLAEGDVDGDVRRALRAFPAPCVVDRVMQKYFPGAQGTQPSAESEKDASSRRNYKLLSLPRLKLTLEREWLLILANFVEVYLAKEQHAGLVGINYLHKIQFPTLPSLYGAMLAGVDVVLVGAGIPADIPEVLDRLSRHERVSISLEVADGGEEKFEMHFEPAALLAEVGMDVPTLRRPKFLAIVSSATLARALLKRAAGGIDGFIVEGPMAGGHNAPPRGVQQLTERGEPIYGTRDVVVLEQMVAMQTPFWLAGGYGSREKYQAARALGAHGIQVGTAFAFCEESGLDPKLRRRFLVDLLRGEAEVFTDPVASPTSFPFKVSSMAGTLSEQEAYEQRPRLCDMGYLRRAYRRPDGKVGYRCPAEPVAEYVKKGGKAEDTIGRKCLCNALMANIGLGQRRPDGYEERPLLTAGDDLECILPFLSDEKWSYSARDVVAAILSPDPVAIG